MAGQPQVERRHRHDGVLVQQRRQRRHVVPLEGRHVAVQQLALLVVQRVGHGRRGRPVVPLGEGRPGPLERAVDRRDRRAEQLGDLTGPPGQHLAQDQHRPLLGRQLLQRRHERQPHRLLGHGRLGRVLHRGQHARVGHGFQPGVVGAGGEGGPRQRRGLLEVHRAGPLVARGQHVQADVGRDAVEPGAQAGPPLERGVAPPGPHERVLHRVLGLEGGAEHPVAVPGQLGPVPLQPDVEVLDRRRAVRHRRPPAPVAVLCRAFAPLLRKLPQPTDNGPSSARKPRSEGVFRPGLPSWAPVHPTGARGTRRGAPGGVLSAPARAAGGPPPAPRACRTG